MPSRTPAATADTLPDTRPSADPEPQTGELLPPLTAQAELLLARGIVPAETLSPAALRDAAAALEPTAPAGSLLVVHPRLLAPSALAPHLRRTTTARGHAVERRGFVVTDMTDVDDFAPVPGLDVPDADVYAVAAPDRGDAMANWSPEEAEPAIAARGRSPLTLAEGIHWVLQSPDALARNVCFMTIGSRLRRPNGSYDARTPAVWISNGTGRDGAERRGAAKVGWCWWRNRHTWLGFASTAARQA
ncbi:DUF5701 family protein [Krasilnikoviella flava]|uniref:Uncharacterized protein n=1 Tax=Krasilnikoviella flava TaxID=526729 RepID=A0A1T5LAW8_9MICO|nr:DUF5701 family protein [Krasilnikoviella flava]SKC72568.1 hypothetical protein SAMN04324258_3181 [Krasilnikoviella flava]